MYLYNFLNTYVFVFVFVFVCHIVKSKKLRLHTVEVIWGGCRRRSSKNGFVQFQLLAECSLLLEEGDLNSIWEVANIWTKLETRKKSCPLWVQISSQRKLVQLLVIYLEACNQMMNTRERVSGEWFNLFKRVNNVPCLSSQSRINQLTNTMSTIQFVPTTPQLINVSLNSNLNGKFLASVRPSLSCTLQISWFRNVPWIYYLLCTGHTP